MLRKRLIYRFVFQIMIAGLLLVGLAIGILVWMFNAYNTIQIERNFSPYGLSKLISEADIDENGNIINSELLKRLEADGGWLQSLDENGNVLQSFFTPDDVPKKYIPAQLIDYWTGKKPFPYTLGLWIQLRDEHTFILLYGKPSVVQETLSPIIEDAQIIGGNIVLSDEVTTELHAQNKWIQVFNDEGTEVASWNKPSQVGDSYTLMTLALNNKYYLNDGIAVDSEYDEKTGLTWIIQYPIQDPVSTFNFVPNLSPELLLIIISSIFFIGSSLIVFIILAIWYANRFMKPIMEIVTHIQRLGNGQLLEGEQTKVNNKRRKNLFFEVFDSIDAVALKLQASKAAEKQTETYREEWIAGVMHDMKTPLSSIEGYAHMLAAEQYKWSEEDIREFAHIMLEKSQYMDQLLEDLALTYRLRSGKLPFPLTKQNIGILLYELVSKTKLHPIFANRNISVKLPENIDVYGDVYAPWFERVVYNLVANAMLHNPEHTTMTITLSPIHSSGWQITFSDNGNGMDEKMVKQLFERYYRGTSTDAHAEGSGLGMAITKELVQAMNGTIDISSTQGKGTTITLSWND